MIAVLVVVGALWIRPLMFGGTVGEDGFGAAPFAGRDVITWSNAGPLTGGTRQDTSNIWPPAPADARAEPIGTPPPVGSSSTDYAFLASLPEIGGRPVTWDPCRPIHLVHNDAHAPAEADQLLRQAVSSVSSATGLQFVIDGSTAEMPTAKRPPLAKSRYGNRWSPVLVAWTDPSVVPELEGAVAGIAGPVSAPYYTAAQHHWVSGTVYLDGPQFRELLKRGDGGPRLARSSCTSSATLLG